MNNIIPPQAPAPCEALSALRTIHADMVTCRSGGDEWASEWLGDFWTQFPLSLRAMAGDDDALGELAETSEKPLAPPVVDRETAAHVLHMFGHDGGYPPGDYMGAAYTLIARSDVQNAARLALAFPAQAEAVRMASYDEDGIAKLTAIAAGGAS